MTIFNNSETNNKNVVLFDANSLMKRLTGVGYYTDGLVKQLANSGMDIELTGYYFNFLGRKKNLNYHFDKNIKFRPVYHIPGQIVNLLRRWHINIPVELLSFTKSDFILYPNFLGAPSLFKIPMATVIHDLTFIDFPNYVSKKNLHDLQKYVPQQIKRSSFVITVSEFSKERIHKIFNVPTSKILVTPIPPTTPVSLSSETSNKVLSKLGIEGNYILTLGTVEPRKNITKLIEAYLLLPETTQNKYSLIIAGKIGWNCTAEIQKLAEVKRNNKNVIHLGYVSDKQRATLYQNASLFISASHYEGFGMPILEAMNYGIPCAISDIPVFREVANTAAEYFNQEDTASISTTISRLINDREYRKRMSIAGKARASKYSWRIVAEKLLDQINKTISERNCEKNHN